MKKPLSLARTEVNYQSLAILDDWFDGKQNFKTAQPHKSLKLEACFSKKKHGLINKCFKIEGLPPMPPTPNRRDSKMCRSKSLQN